MGLGDIGITKASFKTGKGSAVLNVLTDFGRSVTNALRKELERQKINASDEMAETIRFTANYLGNQYVFKLYMIDYYKAVDKGRGASKKGSKPGKLRPALEEWIAAKGIDSRGIILSIQRKAKGLSTSGKEFNRKRKTLSSIKATKQLAFLIARKIHKKGTEPTNFYSNVVSDQFLNAWKSKIAKAAKLDIVESIRIY